MRRRVEELRERADTAAPAGEVDLSKGDDLAIHAIPDPPRPRGTPFGLSTAIHLLVLIVLLVEARFGERVEPLKTPLTFSLDAPQPAREAPSEARVVPPHSAPPPARAEPRPPAPAASAKRPIEPPKVPEEIPPPVPLPAPKRMGELVPVPHLPVPGTVPPEEGKPGKPGPPREEADRQAAKTLPGTPDGQSERDPGAGGPGTTGTPAGGFSEGPAPGTVEGGATGRILVPPAGGGRREGIGGGGRRKGLNLQVPVDGGAFGEFSFDDKDYDWSDYYSQMYWAIWRAWYNRLYAMSPVFERWSYQNHTAVLKGSVLVHFVIERNGSVSSIVVLDPSSVPPLDESAEAALKEVILPRLPDDYARDSAGLRGQFSMEVADVMGWKEQMKWMKYKGVF